MFSGKEVLLNQNILINKDIHMLIVSLIYIHFKFDIFILSVKPMRLNTFYSFDNKSSLNICYS